MQYTPEVIIFIVLLLDSLIASSMAWLGGEKWFIKNFRAFSRYFPLTKGWTAMYLILVLYIGYLTLN